MYRYAIHNAGVAVTLKKVHVPLVCTMELLLKDPLNKGHNKFDLSIKDKFCGPYRIMTIQFMVGYISQKERYILHMVITVVLLTKLTGLCSPPAAQAA